MKAEIGFLKLSLTYITKSKYTTAHAYANRDKCTQLSTYPHVIIFILSNHIYYICNKQWHWARLEVVNLILVGLVGHLQSPEFLPSMQMLVIVKYTFF